MNIIEFTSSIVSLSLSQAQQTLLKSFYGLALSNQEAEIFQQCTERPYEPREYFDVTCIAGARSGKDSRIATPIALYEAFSREHSYLHPGEKGYVVIVAQDQRGGQIMLNYIRAAINGADVLAAEVEDDRKNEIELRNGIVIACYPCTFRAARGFTIICAIADEAAFWRDENSSNPDVEIIRSLRRGMANVPNAKLVKISTPYGKSGVLYDDFARRHELRDTLVWRAPTWVMNPSILQRFLDREREKDPVAFAREYGAEFSEDIATFLPAEVIESAIGDYLELEPEPARFRYVAACDPAAGGADQFTLAISHRDQKRIVVDLVRGWKASKPENVVDEIVGILRQYRVSQITGDRFSKMWVQDAFKRRGVRYFVADKTRSEFYLEALAPLNQGKVEIPRNPTLVRELRGLERRAWSSGKEQINHGPGQHDDYANSAAIVIVKLSDFAGKRVARVSQFPSVLQAQVDAYVTCREVNYGAVLPGQLLRQMERQERDQAADASREAREARLAVIPELPGNVEALSESELVSRIAEIRHSVGTLLGRSQFSDLLQVATARKRTLELQLSKLRRFGVTSL